MVICHGRAGADDPRIVGGYQVFGLLGRGGMGRVYLARAADGGGVVALKVVNRELAGQDEFRNRFRREVRAARTAGTSRAWTTAPSGMARRR
jgi:serine/threonine protein kinase